MMEIIEQGLEILKQLGLTYEWRDHTRDFLKITDPVTGEWTCRDPYGTACLLSFLMKTDKLRLSDDEMNSVFSGPTDKEVLSAQVKELNRLAETFGNSVDTTFGELCYWRHRHPISPKDKASPRIFTAKDALDPKRRHREARWYFSCDEIAELRETILHDRAIYAQYFTIED